MWKPTSNPQFAYLPGKNGVNRSLLLTICTFVKFRMTVSYELATDATRRLLPALPPQPLRLKCVASEHTLNVPLLPRRLVVKTVRTDGERSDLRMASGLQKLKPCLPRLRAKCLMKQQTFRKMLVRPTHGECKTRLYD